METTIATTLAPDELAALDQLRRDQRISRAEAVRAAVCWYVQWADRLPVEDPAEDDVDP
jgi:Ribbon-helix-helix protein, copG family